MPGDSKPFSDSSDAAIPATLHADLKNLFPQPAIPVEVDGAILASAKMGYERRAVWRPVVWRATWAASIAATLLIAFSIIAAIHRTTKQLAQIGDINHDGKVDIVDALVVARALADGTKLDPAWDVNHDGVVDQKDVDWIAATAVNVSGSGVTQ